MVFIFDGSDDRIIRSVTNFASGWTVYTVASWIKSDVTSSDNGWFHLREPAGEDDAGGVRYDASGVDGGGTNLLKFGLMIGAVEVQAESVNNSQTTTLQHVVGRWQNGTQIEIWINGVETAYTSQDAIPIGTSIDAGNNQLTLGGGPKDDDPFTGWDGSVYEHRVYNRYLSQSEIETLYACRGTDNITLNLELKYGDVAGTFGGTIPMTANLIKDLSDNGQDLTVADDVQYGDNYVKQKRKIM